MKLRRYHDVESFVASLRLHHPIALHSTILLVAAALGGLLVSKLLLWMGLEMPFVRFPIAVVAAYGLFLLFVDWWLAYIGLQRASEPQDPGVYPEGGGADVATGVEGAGGTPRLEGAGGTFDGGGASASWDGGAEAKGALAYAKGEAAVRGKGAVAYVGLESKAHGAAAAGEAASAAGIEEAATGLGMLAELALPIAILVAVLGFFWMAGGWILGGPALLVEVAVEVALASGLIRSVARRRDGQWLSSLFSRTASRAAALGVAALILGVGVRLVDPNADTIGQAVAVLFNR